MLEPQRPNSIDVPFSVPFVHRLRFTRDVLGADQEVLCDVLAGSEGEPARVQFWVDQNLLEARPEVRHRLRAFAQQNSDRITQVGGVQVVPGGEEIKNEIHILERMLKVFNAANLDRRSYVVVVGGGAVLDAVGFAAAIAHRGLRLVRLPTTTLAQDDSGVGVKNAVNLFQKKNWLGAFAVPWAVINDAALLETLSDRDFRCGFAEAVKVALLRDAEFFRRLCELAPSIQRRDMDAALPVIQESAHWHLDHITQGGDPFEMLEARPLDFGHWSAHKLESLSDFELRHGEAVAIGVAIDTVYSTLMHGLPRDVAGSVLRCLAELGFRLSHAALDDTRHLFDGIEEFRQHMGGRLTLTMLRDVGDPIEVHAVDLDAMRVAITEVSAFEAARDQEISRTGAQPQRK